MFGVNDNHNDNNQAGQPSDNNPPADQNAPAPANPISEVHDPVTPPVTVDSSGPTPPPSQPTDTQPAGNEDLLKLKQDALKDLEPMVDKLEQTPGEKFKTIMMLIQASDNSGLVKEAYECAKKITDEKERAQALIDVINEINYFTQKA